MFKIKLLPNRSHKQVDAGGARDTRPPLYLHVGTHKTGTTSLQLVLRSNVEYLKKNGVLYPIAGIPEGSFGHHNLAWQIACDRRFRTSFGTIDEVAAQIHAHPGPVILSSEDFETFLDRPEALNMLTKHQGLSGHRLIIVLYLREQADYFRSLFMELSKHGFADEMARAAMRVTSDRYIEFNEWRFQFDYCHIVARLSEWCGTNPVVRNWHSLRSNSTVCDFAAIACPGLELPEADLEVRANQELPIAQIAYKFFETRLGAPLSAEQKELIRAAAEPQNGKERGLSYALREKIHKTFARSNSRLRRRTGLSFVLTQRDTSISRGSRSLEQIFSLELQTLLMADIGT